jgi:hypothetical protein
MVLVLLPLNGVKMEFYLTEPECTIYEDAGVEEIGTCIVVVISPIDNANG